MRPAVVLFFVLLPLQWLALGGTPLGQARLHQVVILGLAALVAVQYPLRRYAPVLRTSAVFVLANVYMVATIAAVQVYNGLGVQPAAQQALYLFAFVALGGLFHQVATGRAPALLRTLRHCALVLTVSLLVGLAASMALNGINPAAVLAQTIATADPELFQKELYKSAFVGFGISEEEAQGNFRHEIFGSAVLAMLISTWAMRTGAAPTRGDRRAYSLGIALGVFLLVLSLSRSIIIAALVWPLLAVVRAARRAELSGRQIAIIYGTGILLGGVLVSGLGVVIFNRFFTDTTGYEARAGNYFEALSVVPDVWATGGYDTSGTGASSHNFVFDTLLRHGIFAAVPAAVIVVFLLVAFCVLAARLARMRPAMVPVVAALALPLVRLGTAGGGLIPPVEWVALAFVAGVVAAEPVHRRTAVTGRVASRSRVGAGV